MNPLTRAALPDKRAFLGLILLDTINIFVFILYLIAHYNSYALSWQQATKKYYKFAAPHSSSLSVRGCLGAEYRIYFFRYFAVAVVCHLPVLLLSGGRTSGVP
jgi:hypothetical protein